MTWMRMAVSGTTTEAGRVAVRSHAVEQRLDDEQRRRTASLCFSLMRPSLAQKLRQRD